MTILDFNCAIQAFRKLKESGIDRENAIRSLFHDGVGRLELIKVLEVVECLTPTESRKIVTKILAA